MLIHHSSALFNTKARLLLDGGSAYWYRQRRWKFDEARNFEFDLFG